MPVYTVAEPPFWDQEETTEDLIIERSQTPSAAWDTVVLGGRTLPGLCSVKGKKAGRIDKKQTPGKTGVVITHLGYEPAQVDIEMRIWTPRHWADWMGMIADFQPKAKRGPPAAFSVVYPSLNVYGIVQLYIVAIGLPRDIHPRGTKQIDLTCQEWNPESIDATNTVKALKPDYTSTKTVAQSASLANVGNKPAPPVKPSTTKAGPV